MSLSETFLVSPLSVGGCQLWLDAADSTTITLSGTSVTQWNDKSGNARHFSQASAGNRPTFGTYLSYPSLSFTGASSQSLSNNYIQTGTGGRHTYLVFADISTTANVYGNPVMFFMADGNSSQGGDWRAAFDGVNQYLSIDVSAGAKTMRTSPNVTSMRAQRTLGLWGMATGAKVSDSYVYGNGTQFTTQVLAFAQDPTINTTNSPPTRIGGGQTGYATFALFELLHFNVELTRSDQQKIEGYLAWKWGLTANLPSNHPYKNSRPLDGIQLPTSLLVPSRPLRNVFVFNPTVVSNCVLWLDAADISTMFQDSAGAIPARTTGSTVSLWKDKSSSGNHASNTTAQPTLTIGAQNGLNVLNFNGAQYLTLSTNTLPTGSTNCTFFFITRTPSTSVQVFFTYGQDPNTINRNPQFYYNSGRLNIDLYGGGLLSDNTIFTNSYVMTSCTFTNRITAWDNGTQFSGGSTAITLNTGTGWASIGVGRVPPGTALNYYFNGQMGEMILFNRELSSQERLQMEGYLAWKWGLETNLPTSHLQKTNPPDLPAAGPRAIPQLKSAFFNPRTIGGVQLWYDVADSSTRTVIGTTVSQLNDKSGNNYHATQTVSASRPFLATNRLVQFANNTYFDFPQAAINNTTRYSLFLVFNPIASVNWILQKQSNGVGSYNMLSMTNYWQNNTGTTNFLYWGPHANTGVVNAGTALTLNTVQLIEVLFDGTRVFFYRNGILLNTATSGPTLTIQNVTNATNNTIGSWRPDGRIQNSGVTNFFFGELIYHNVALTNQQRQSIEGYLAWKWGLQANLPSTHPFKLFPPSP